LALAGIAPGRIAEILGTSGNSVNGAIAKMREAKILPNRK
jgi:DNA-binding CsgD family transcriptional regulator